MKKEELVHHKVVKLGKIGICRMKQAGVVTLGSLTKAEECLLVDGRKASQGWEVSLSQIQLIVYSYHQSYVGILFRPWLIYFQWQGWSGDTGICSQILLLEL